MQFCNFAVNFEFNSSCQHMHYSYFTFWWGWPPFKGTYCLLVSPSRFFVVLLKNFLSFWTKFKILVVIKVLNMLGYFCWRLSETFIIENSLWSVASIAYVVLFLLTSFTIVRLVHTQYNLFELEYLIMLTSDSYFLLINHRIITH